MYYSEVRTVHEQVQEEDEPKYIQVLEYNSAEKTLVRVMRKDHHQGPSADSTSLEL